MAIYDHDGTTTSEIAKIYDWDGTTANQIGKVYDFDGTTTSEIYSAEIIVADKSQNIVPLNWTPKYTTWSHTITNTSNGVEFHHYAQNGSNEYVLQTGYDLTGYSTLTFVVSKYSEATSTKLGVGSSASVNAQANVAGAINASNTKSFSATGTYTLDISGLTGTNYIHFCMTSNTLNPYVAFSKIIIE